VHVAAHGEFKSSIGEEPDRLLEQKELGERLQRGRVESSLASLG